MVNGLCEFDKERERGAGVDYRLRVGEVRIEIMGIDCEVK